MNEEDFKRIRRSTRLSIAIPVIISGVDADGHSFRESVHTLVVNKHGGKVETTRHLVMGAEIVVENRALGVTGKASVVWHGSHLYPGELFHVGLQLLEAQNVWGIAFPPDDWTTQQREESSRPASAPPAEEPAGAADAETPIPAPASNETNIRLLEEFQESAAAQVQEFKDHLKQLAHQIGLEFQFDLRERADTAKAQEVGALEEQIKTLKETLSLAREEIRKLEGEIQELKAYLQNINENTLQPTPMQEARRQLSALTNSVVERMNRAAEAGLEEYRALLKKENGESAARTRPETEAKP